MTYCLDTNTCIYYLTGRTPAVKERLGRPIGPNDLIIAAIAIATETTLVSHNVAEFNRVEELPVEDWTVTPG